MVDLVVRPARTQSPLAGQPYDRWILPDGHVKAEFHRLPSGFLLRFPGESDFEIVVQPPHVIGWPAPDTPTDHFRSLFDNAVLPLIGNHHGGLFLHGSAVAIGGRAVAFLGHSGDGKTTLAGAFAKAGHPFLTEDVIELVPEGSAYLLQPKPSGLRLNRDSAAWLLGALPETLEPGGKMDVADAIMLPFHHMPAPLSAIFVLGGDHAAPLALKPLPPQAAVQNLLPHAFVLDVEDKPRLAGHFQRIAKLGCDVPCYAIDYLRDYAELPRVMAAIVAVLEGDGAAHD